MDFKNIVDFMTYLYPKNSSGIYSLNYDDRSYQTTKTSDYFSTNDTTISDPNIFNGENNFSYIQFNDMTDVSISDSELNISINDYEMDYQTTNFGISFSTNDTFYSDNNVSSVENNVQI